jgi:ubiquinone/menaquinone biosynthesis C-methylase UbiE
VVDDKISKEWDEASESWADFVRRGVDFYRNEMHGKAFFSLLGRVKGKRVLDLACGEGFNSRLLARKGASVVAVDFSEKMIRLAKRLELKEKLGINYLVSDAADLKELSNNQFDVVCCFMALMDIEFYQEAICSVARVLKDDGRFIFSIVHPCFEYGAVTADGRKTGDWKYDETGDTWLYESSTYFENLALKIDWNMERLHEPFVSSSFHRTLSDYSQALYRNKFLIRRLVEPKPTLRAISRHPGMRKHAAIPHSLIIEAIKKEK